MNGLGIVSVAAFPIYCLQISTEISDYIKDAEYNISCIISIAVPHWSKAYPTSVCVCVCVFVHVCACVKVRPGPMSGLG